MRKIILLTLAGFALQHYVKRNPSSFLARSPWARTALGAMFARR